MLLIAYTIMLIVLIVLKTLDCLLTYKVVKTNPNQESMLIGRWLMIKIGPLKAVILVYLLSILIIAAIMVYFIYGSFIDKILAFVSVIYLIIVLWFVVLTNKNVIKENHEKANYYRKIVMFLIGYPLMKKLKLAY